jgi:hypothetical protein
MLSQAPVFNAKAAVTQGDCKVAHGGEYQGGPGPMAGYPGAFRRDFSQQNRIPGGIEAVQQRGFSIQLVPEDQNESTARGGYEVSGGRQRHVRYSGSESRRCRANN